MGSRLAPKPSCSARPRIFLAVTLADLINGMAETFVTGRTAQRVMLSLRIRIWAQLQRLSLDYYEGEMAGRIMTRMTTDVDQFESLIENGLLSALVSIVTFVGVAIALVVINPELGLLVMTLAVPMAVVSVLFRRRASVLYNLSRERIAILNADFQESLSGVREAQAFSHEAESIQRFHRLGRNYFETRVAAQRLVGLYFPFISQFVAGCADAIVLGVGAGLVVSGRLSTGALIAFILYIDMFFSPIQQLSQVFDSWQQTRVSVGRIADLMSLETKTPEAAEPVEPDRLAGRDRVGVGAVCLPGSGGPAGGVRWATGRAPPRPEGRTVAACRPTPRLAGRPRPSAASIFEVRAGRDGRPGRRNGGREIDAGEAHRPLLRPGHGPSGRRRRLRLA